VNIKNNFFLQIPLLRLKDDLLPFVFVFAIFFKKNLNYFLKCFFNYFNVLMLKINFKKLKKILLKKNLGANE
jgi:hypothetical protein